jgi:putative oxidoreductase
MQNILNALVAQTGWTILLIRIVLGVIFIAHGWPKLKNFKGTVGWLGGAGFKPGWLWAGLLTAGELLGGLCILAGFYVQIAALVLTVSMIVAMIYKIRNKTPFLVMTAPGWEFDLLIIAALLLLATTGSGYLSFLG